MKTGLKVILIFLSLQPGINYAQLAEKKSEKLYSVEEINKIRAISKCPLIKNRESKNVFDLKTNKYTIINEKEIVTYKVSGKKEKWIYSTDYEKLIIKKNKHDVYSYSYILKSDANRIKINKNKKGVTSANKKGYKHLNHTRENVGDKIKASVKRCSLSNN